MDAVARLPQSRFDKRVVGQGLGLLVGVLGVLASSVTLFVPLNWSVGSNPPASKTMAAIEYLFGTHEAHDIFIQSTLVLLVSLFVVHVVWTESVQTLWLITGLLGIVGIGSLQYRTNTGTVFTTVAILLTLSAVFLTAAANDSGS